ncbi:MAG: nuclear transport factor 2 family protein [bacterium]|nr:nuclear transport factor 2 family protein [bacterium]
MLVPLLAVALFLLLVYWARRRTQAARRILAVGFAVAALLVVVQALVVTDRERLVQVSRDLADACRRADLEAFAAYVSPGFQSDPGAGTWDREALVGNLERILHRYQIEELSLRSFEFDLDESPAVVRFAATCRIITTEQIIGHIFSRWELHFEPGPQGWRVVNIRPIPTPMFPYRRLTDFSR